MASIINLTSSSNSVMWETYGIVCLKYEVAGLEAMGEQLRATRFYSKLQERLAAAEMEQCEFESRLRARMIREAESELGMDSSESGASAKKQQLLGVFSKRRKGLIKKSTRCVLL